MIIENLRTLNIVARRSVTFLFSLRCRQPRLQRATNTFINHTLSNQNRRPTQFGAGAATIKNSLLRTAFPIIIGRNSHSIRMTYDNFHCPLGKIRNIKMPNGTIINAEFYSRHSLQFIQIVPRR